MACSCVSESLTETVVVFVTASRPVWMTGRLFRCVSASADGVQAGLTPFSQVWVM